MKTKWIILLLLGVVCASAQAQQTVTRKLSDFYTGSNPLRLQGQRDHNNLSVPLAGNQKVISASVTLNVVSSKALIEKRSILNVRFNNATVGQIPFDPERTQLTSEITIPARLWRAGFNTLTLGVSQYYAQQCVDGGAPELWSEIDLARSQLTLTTEVGTDRPGLNTLSSIFSPGIGAQSQVSIVSPQGGSPIITEQALPLVAQALALRNQYAPLNITSVRAGSPADALSQRVSASQISDAVTAQWSASSWYVEQDKPGSLHALVGTRSELEALISDTTHKSITGPYLGIEKTSGVSLAGQTIVPARYRLVVSGQNEKQVIKAARALGVMDDALNPDASVVIEGQLTSSNASPLAAHILQPGNEYTFAQMGEANNIMRGEDDFAKEVKLVLPADFYVAESASMTLNLDFGYGAAMGPGSMMNILINDELVHGRPLDNLNGESYRKYQLTIPARHLHGGINTLSFLVTMRSPITGQECDDISGSHLLFQLRNTSSLILPDAGKVATLPDLGLFSDTGYPFARQDISEPVNIYVTQPQMESAALTLTGKLAQTAGTLLPNIEVSQGLPETLADNAIVLATPAGLPDDLAQAYGVSVGATKQWPYRLQNELHNRIHKLTDDKSHRPLTTHGVTRQQGSLGDMAVLIAQRNPKSEGEGSLFIIATESTQMMTQRVNELVSLELWGQMAGDFFSWNNNAAPLLVMQVAEQYEVGEAGNVWLKLRLWLSNNPWYWLIGVLLLVIVTMLIAVALLRRRNKAVTEDW